jgi:hypothetical protein
MDRWWKKLKFWLWQDCPWNNIPRRDDFLLHCALFNPDVSPWIIELVLECFPRSASIPLPESNGCYPLHIACVAVSYVPLPFEFPNSRISIEMVAKCFRDAMLLKWNNQLPIHLDRLVTTLQLQSNVHYHHSFRFEGLCQGIII